MSPPKRFDDKVPTNIRHDCKWSAKPQRFQESQQKPSDKMIPPSSTSSFLPSLTFSHASPDVLAVQPAQLLQIRGWSTVGFAFLHRIKFETVQVQFILLSGHLARDGFETFL